MSFFGLRRVELLLLVAILVQSIAIIIVYEGALNRHPKAVTLNADGKLATDDVNDAKIVANNTTIKTEENPPNDAKEEVSANDVNPAASLERLTKPLPVHHTTPNPGGLILSASFSYMQDPREVHRKKPRPWILPTFESMYHYHTTITHVGLHSIIFHDDKSFNQTFVDKHASDYIKFVRVESPTFDHGEPVISPNDFRFVVFDRWLKANSERDEKNGQIRVNGIPYDWYMIADLDMMFQRNPFTKMDEYSKMQNLTFFGSFDGGRWEDENMHLQRRLFRNCYGRSLILTWKDLELKTENGNCGLWAGRHADVSCILDCMASQYDAPPIRGKGSSTICDMVTHDYCVHYGGCFPGSTKGVYDEKKVGVLWGSPSLGDSNDLFGPPYGRYRQCDRDTWTVIHNRCDWKGPLCFRKDENGELVKYHQNVRGRKCKLDLNTGLPLTDAQLNVTQ